MKGSTRVKWDGLSALSGTALTASVELSLSSLWLNGVSFPVHSMYYVLKIFKIKGFILWIAHVHIKNWVSLRKMNCSPPTFLFLRMMRSFFNLIYTLFLNRMKVTPWVIKKPSPDEGDVSLMTLEIRWSFCLIRMRSNMKETMAEEYTWKHCGKSTNIKLNAHFEFEVLEKSQHNVIVFKDFSSFEEGLDVFENFCSPLHDAHIHLDRFKNCPLLCLYRCVNV